MGGGLDYDQYWERSEGVYQVVTSTFSLSLLLSPFPSSAVKVLIAWVE